jgi:RNA polymerase sigma-70 factor, ECF subfamily
MMDNLHATGTATATGIGAEQRRAYVLGKTAWPQIELGIECFAEFIRRHSIATDVPIEILHDLFLACACGQAEPSALSSFRKRYLHVVAAAVRSFDSSPEFADEIYQRLSESLFVAAPGAEARIVRYKGQGPLAGFVRTAARRIGMRVSAAAARFQGEEALVQQFSQARELEATLLELQCREAINRALSVALRQLPRRERLILRMNLVEKVSTTRIAAMYKVSQPTVSRWIQRSARTIHETVKELVCDELEVDTRELESLLSLVRSQIEITISRDSTTGAASIV